MSNLSFQSFFFQSVYLALSLLIIFYFSFSWKYIIVSDYSQSIIMFLYLSIQFTFSHCVCHSSSFMFLSLFLFTIWELQRFSAYLFPLMNKENFPSKNCTFETRHAFNFPFVLLPTFQIHFKVSQPFWYVIKNKFLSMIQVRQQVLTTFDEIWKLNRVKNKI